MKKSSRFSISFLVFNFLYKRMMAVANETAVLKFSKVSENAFAPHKGSDKAAGYDLRSAYDYVVPARGKELIKTDISIELPPGCYGRIAPRSGLAWKNHIDVGAGVIDEDYRGNVGVVLFNHSDQDFKVNKGDRIAQLICQRIEYPVLQEVTNLNNTERGAGGFGSTGTK
ncbi:deoxyuridine 5'-triphosphate nucleotidohydrolase isoform X3 [Diaphorina citri]|uniref:Deoxyuridine 5'-triphosphate nucleotidohydrolase n=2 Tax=Diaphorina citri TaxID=121845 RepID=A0A1S3DDU0_DIACI|nr:deoxyuridine 5'-triphosphate nucleotidohydrolase isoform X1 [Diaphorina citri]XP_017302595.1 deoxyuridine 5'-triphosphate nucleotidohydrolase isoform X2 [Diaphorina citri]XP_017302596.1 deoxyuridine 5'-triphosphate nucleotidohydrolase isoform X4 [Diaphorina citri]XP_026684716.1 deoxyuridine 5'-triphosphate nucleotidohydrolase isoform X3 [Diaphorina citri]